MNTKRNQGIIVFVGVLIAAWAYAQMGMSNDGVMFPDGTVQTTAHSSSIEYYHRDTYWNGEGSHFFCYFDVPAGKILMIESISGVHYGEGNHEALVIIRVYKGPPSSSLFLPTVSEYISTSFVFEAKTVDYVEDSNNVPEGSGGTRDFRVSGEKPESGSNFTYAECNVIGRLYDAPEA